MSGSTAATDDSPDRLTVAEIAIICYFVALLARRLGRQLGGERMVPHLCAARALNI